MKQVHALLLEGQGESARHRLHSLLAQEPGKSAAAADVLVGILGSCYDQFQVKAVHDFCRDLELAFPAVVCDRIQQALGPRIQRTAEWINILRGVTRERLVRECRDAIIHKELKKAAVHGATLLERAQGEAELDDSAVLLARGLATLQRDREGALTVVGYLMRAGNKTHSAAPIVADQFTQMSREFRTVSYTNDSLEWSQQLTDAILGFRAYLPGMMEVGEPEDGHVERFYEEAHACLRAGMHHLNKDDFIDALAVLMEYCPTDPPLVRNAAGVEERMFLKLGPRAKLVTVRGIGRLGELAQLRKMVLGLAREDGSERIRLLAAIMGGLRHADFYPYLRATLDKVDNRRDEARTLEAIGRIGSPEAVKLLLDRLGQSVKRIHTPGLGKTIVVMSHESTARELSPEDRVCMVLTALGRIARYKGVDPKFRNEIIKRTLELLDKEDRKLAFQAASEMFSVRLEELDPALKNWAAQKAVEAMWGQPLSQPDGVSANGWREPMVNLVTRLGREVLPVVLTAAAKYATRYSGALGALANALAEIGDPSCVPVLETMLRTAFLHQDDTPQSKLIEERVVDAATGETRLLDRDELIHTLLYTILKAGEAEGIKLVLDYADQVQGGRLHAPGPQTINMLVDVKLKLGRMELKKTEAETPVVDPKVLKQTTAQARGGLLTRKATQIAAIAQLGQMKQLGGVPVLLELLGDKDPMVASAAHIALAQFLNPLPGEKPYCDFLDSMLEHAELINGGRVMEKFMAFVNRELPKNPPYDRLLERQLEIMLEDEGALAHRIRGAMRRPKDKDLLERVKSESLRPSGAAEPEDNGGFIDDDRLTRQSGLDQRRAYYEARREWVRNGKVGEAPRPPAGLD